MGARDSEAHLLWYASPGAVVHARSPKLTTVTGKILKNEDTVESCKIEEKGFVVCVVNKVRSYATLTPAGHFESSVPAVEHLANQI